MNKLTLTVFSLLATFGCTDSPTSNNQRISELEEELTSRDEKINKLQKQLTEQNEGESEYWYAFKPADEHNITKLGSGESEQIDLIELEDSVDVIYTFKHSTSISQINDNRTASFLDNFKEFKETLHRTKNYGPNASGTSYNVRTFIVCEEDGLPIETENCTDNIYILVQPTELGYESNLFKISRLFHSEIKSQVDTEDGIVLTLEHSRFPRKELRVLIRPELVKFLE